jgi:hypothetical protein
MPALGVLMPDVITCKQLWGEGAVLIFYDRSENRLSVHSRMESGFEPRWPGSTA